MGSAGSSSTVAELQQVSPPGVLVLASVNLTEAKLHGGINFLLGKRPFVLRPACAC